ncbi:pentapeptide repeat-containing protein [Croceibacter atlanticus]|uniref:pentapeptide repeat-containing protein n=1 Tax=Croceibacter atlanticus TaxID=313588 RepID=UPI0030FAB893
MARTNITEEDFKAHFSLADGLVNASQPIRFNSKKFDFYIKIIPQHRELIFIDCEFSEPILFCKGIPFVAEVQENDNQENLFNQVETNVFSKEVLFKECDFLKLIQFDDLNFNGKFRMHDCVLKEVSFRNTTFNDLADFWSTSFNNNLIFHKTNFNETVVFSMATFSENVLFTYTLFGGKAIFSKTKFNKGLDFSQAIISGELKLFDLQINYTDFVAPYVGIDDKVYQDYIDTTGKIPLVNKVHTFQVLKKAFEDIGNHSDSILMHREEKRALRALTKERLRVKDKSVNKGDKTILWLNRWSNHYRSDFRNGLWFTVGVTVVFGFLTLLFTEEFQRHFCWCCEFDKEYFIKGVKFLFNFLNPARRITYLDIFDLKFYGIAYLFDFLGRIAVGYGFYQTVQAFRKFK